MANVLVTPDAQEQIDALPLTIHHRVHEVLKRLEKWPQVSGAKPLSGNLAGQYRIRTGDYRVQFRVAGVGADADVLVVRVGKRDRFYD